MSKQNNKATKPIKNFLKLGATYIDAYLLCSMNFKPDKSGYVTAVLHFLSKDKPVFVKVKDKNELAEFFLQLDSFLDGELKSSLVKLIDQIDELSRE